MKKGFTFIELILYIAIVGMVMSAMLPVAWEVVGGGTRSMVDREVAATARNVLERIKYEIRNAKNITSVSSSSLVLEKYSGGTTTVDLNAGQIRIDSGTGPVRINSENTTATNLVFTDYSSADGKTKNIQVEMTLEANFSSTLRQEFEETVNLQTAVEVRGI